MQIRSTALYIAISHMNIAFHNKKDVAVSKLCNYGVMTREPVERFVYLLQSGLNCSAESVF